MGRTVSGAPWPTDKEAHAHMRMRKSQNLVSCQTSRAEAWMAMKLRATGLKWTRQSQSGYRLFDFWNHRLGVAVEVDGPEHNAHKDAARDADCLRSRGILVIRVRNFDEDAAAEAIKAIGFAEPWNVRRRVLGLKPILGGD